MLGRLFKFSAVCILLLVLTACGDIYRDVVKNQSKPFNEAVIKDPACASLTKRYWGDIKTIYDSVASLSDVAIYKVGFVKDGVFGTGKCVLYLEVSSKAQTQVEVIGSGPHGEFASSAVVVMPAVFKAVPWDELEYIKNGRGYLLYAQKYICETSGKMYASAFTFGLTDWFYKADTGYVLFPTKLIKSKTKGGKVLEVDEIKRREAKRIKVKIVDPKGKLKWSGNFWVIESSM